ncbi:hypothetical protein MTO96_045882 [Rhipicephalus appendiculatus]
MNQSNVTFVGTNTDFSNEPLLAKCNLVKSAIKEINGTKIGILGAVIPTTQYGSSPGSDYPEENKRDLEGQYPYVVNRSDGSRALVVQDFCFGKFLGRLDVTFNSTGHVVGWGGNPIFLNASIPEDENITEVLRPFKTNLTERMKQVVGSTRVLMEHKDDICRMQECNLGNLIADAYFEYYLNQNTTDPPAWSDINGAVVNAGSIRTALPSFL